MNTFHPGTEVDALTHPLIIGTGCVVDQSQGSSLDLMVRVISLAEQIGYPVSIDIETATRQYKDGSWDASEALSWEFDGVLEWLNDNLSAYDHCWFVQDNSLYYEKIDEEWAL